MSHTKNNEFKYPCVHSTPKAGIRYMYSKVNDRGHFGVSKVIFGEAGINDVIIDMDGEYGLTNGAIGIKINTLEEGGNILSADIPAGIIKNTNNIAINIFFISYLPLSVVTIMFRAGAGR
jgi:hypothetical protein